jgi:hypothetical protein
VLTPARGKETVIAFAKQDVSSRREPAWSLGVEGEPTGLKEGRYFCWWLVSAVFLSRVASLSRRCSHRNSTAAVARVAIATAAMKLRSSVRLLKCQAMVRLAFETGLGS